MAAKRFPDFLGCPDAKLRAIAKRGSNPQRRAICQSAPNLTPHCLTGNVNEQVSADDWGSAAGGRGASVVGVTSELSRQMSAIRSLAGSGAEAEIVPSRSRSPRYTL
jgi:hypothetical protein